MTNDMIKGRVETVINVEACLVEPKRVAAILSDTWEAVTSSQGNVKLSATLETMTKDRGRLLNVRVNISTLPKDRGKLLTKI
jgi:hypothetical protein